MPRLNREGRPTYGARDAADLEQAEPGGGLDLSVFADIAVSLGRVADELERERERRRRFATSLHMVNVPALQIDAASKTLDMADLLGPRTGKMWDITWMSCATFTGGTVSVWKNAAQDTNLRFNFVQAGVWEPSQFLLGRGDRMLIGSNSAFTGTANIAFEAVEFDEWLLPDYLL